MLVDVLEEARELPVGRHLVQRARRAGDRVEGRQDQRQDEHDRDQPVEQVRSGAPAEHLPAKWTKIVFGSTRPALPERRVPDHDHEGDRDHHVDEQAVGALEIHGDLGVAIGVTRLADVARCRLHGDDVPGEQEREGDGEGQPPVMELAGEEAAPVGVAEVEELPEVDDGRVEDPRDGQEGQRDHRQEGERGREQGAEAKPAEGRDREQNDPDDRIPSVQYAICVWIGVKPAVERLKRSTM